MTMKQTIVEFVVCLCALAAMLLVCVVMMASPADANNLSVAKRYVGTNPTGRASLWCATFVNMIERKAGRRGTGSDMARSFITYGTRVSTPRPGDIVVSTRRGGGKGSGHVGIFSHYEKGRPVLVNGNQNGRVGLAPPPGAVIAIVRP